MKKTKKTEKPNPERLHTCDSNYITSFEITKLQKWRTDEWQPGQGGGGCGYKRVTGGRFLWLLNCFVSFLWMV